MFYLVKICWGVVASCSWWWSLWWSVKKQRAKQFNCKHLANYNNPWPLEASIFRPATSMSTFWFLLDLFVYQINNPFLNLDLSKLIFFAIWKWSPAWSFISIGTLLKPVSQIVAISIAWFPRFFGHYIRIVQVINLHGHLYRLHLRFSTYLIPVIFYLLLNSEASQKSLCFVQNFFYERLLQLALAIIISWYCFFVRFSWGILKFYCKIEKHF